MGRTWTWTWTWRKSRRKMKIPMKTLGQKKKSRIKTLGHFEELGHSVRAKMKIRTMIKTVE